MYIQSKIIKLTFFPFQRTEDNTKLKMGKFQRSNTGWHIPITNYEYNIVVLKGQVFCQSFKIKPIYGNAKEKET